MKKIVFLIVLVFFGFNSAIAQTRSERKALKIEKREKAFNELKTLIDSGNFEFNAHRAIPLGNDISRLNLRPNTIFQGNVIDMTTNSNYLRMHKDSLSVMMPFFGTVFRSIGTYGTDNGIQFDGHHTDYSLKYKERKGLIILNFDADGKNDYMQYTLSVGSLNNATLTINTTNRQSITYRGILRPLEKDSEDNK